MAQVQAIKVGYYGHRRVRPGTVFEMPEVNEDLVYIDEGGKPIKFEKLNRDGKSIGKEERKCKWVCKPGGFAEAQISPEEVAKVLSGKNPAAVAAGGSKK